MLWKLGEKEAALERLAQAVRLEPSYEWAWSRLAEWSAELGRPDAAERPARELTERRPGEPRSWMVLAQTLEGADRLEERLQALSTAIRLNPRQTDARDLQASLLAGAGRFAEALEACGDGNAPLTLRGRAAWIEARRGNRRGAIARMTDLVNSDPTYSWGWMQLADWHSEEGNKPEYLEAARHLVRLAPQDEGALGYLADAKLKIGDRAGAKADFRRAIDLAPDFGMGAFRLFDLHLEDGELESASQVLALAQKHIGGPFVVVRELQLAAKQKRLEDAFALLRRLCGMATEERWPYVAALAALSEAGEPAKARTLMRDAAAEEGANPAAASVWARSAAEAGEWGDLRAGLDGLRSRPEVWAEAASEFVQGLATAHLVQDLKAFVAEEGERLRADAGTWGAVGTALESARDAAGTVAWMADWRTRPGVRPWMLSALVVSLRACRKDAEALEAGKAALAMAPDHSYALHRLWVAFEEAVQGRPEAARAAAGEIAPESLNGYYRCLRGMAAALAEGAWEALKAAKTGMEGIEGEAPLLLAYRKALRKIARDRRGTGTCPN
jgi:tetratricopeptide (TPR) repeat protein